MKKDDISACIRPSPGSIATKINSSFQHAEEEKPMKILYWLYIVQD
jgi:hypothetical protein